MIIVRLMGGLGNQMFQYAAGRALACRHQTILKLDTAFLSKNHDDCTPRCLELHNLNVQLECATPVRLRLFPDKACGSSFPEWLRCWNASVSGCYAEHPCARRPCTMTRGVRNRPIMCCWWGAWLGGHAGKVVIAPASWYLRDTIDTTHLCPHSWFRI